MALLIGLRINLKIIKNIQPNIGTEQVTKS